MAFVKAKKEQIWVKLLLAGPSGGGKTFSALRVATGLAKAAGSRVAALDTENGRIRYYANDFDFDDMQMDAPYSPEKYMAAIDEAVKAGYKVLIVDSLSHEWSFCLNLVDNMPGSNTYTKWKTVTPRHDAFKEKILQSPIHIIATVRGKDEYVLEESNGKKVPKKVGLGYSQRDGLEFDYTTTLNLDQNSHRFQATKDNTHLFEDRYDLLTEEDGVALYNWANSGEAAAERSKTPEVQTFTASVGESLQDVISAIDTLAKSLPDIGIKKADIVDAIREVTGGVANYKNITDISVAQDVLNALRQMKKE